MKATLILIAVIALSILLGSGFYTVDMTEQVIVTQFGMPLQAAIEAQRFCSANFPNSFPPHDYFPGRLCIEADMPGDVIAAMRARGYDVEVLARLPAKSGAVCAVMRDPHTGLKHAGADPRREAYALAW